MSTNLKLLRKIPLIPNPASFLSEMEADHILEKKKYSEDFVTI